MQACKHVDHNETSHTLGCGIGNDIRHVQEGTVLLVATTRDNVSPSLVLELLKRIAGIIKVRPALIPAVQAAASQLQYQGMLHAGLLRARE